MYRGIREVRISDNLEERSEGLDQPLIHHLPSDRLGVQRITVIVEPRKEEILERLESLNSLSEQSEQAAATDVEWPAEKDPPRETGEPMVPVLAGSGDVWTRRMAFDIRHRARRR